MLLVILKTKKLLEHFTKNKIKQNKTNQQEFKEREKVINYKLNGKAIIIRLIAR